MAGREAGNQHGLKRHHQSAGRNLVIESKTTGEVDFGHLVLDPRLTELEQLFRELFTLIYHLSNVRQRGLCLGLVGVVLYIWLSIPQ